MLDINGVISVITFHSKEDKIVKDIFKNRSKISSMAANLPIVPDELKPELKVLKKVKPTLEEINNNKRSRSATLRVAIKIK